MCVCLSVCLCLSSCAEYIFRILKPSSYMKVIRSRSRSQEQKACLSLFLCCVFVITAAGSRAWCPRWGHADQFDDRLSTLLRINLGALGALRTRRSCLSVSRGLQLTALCTLMKHYRIVFCFDFTSIHIRTLSEVHPETMCILLSLWDHASVSPFAFMGPFCSVWPFYILYRPIGPFTSRLT